MSERERLDHRRAEEKTFLATNFLNTVAVRVQNIKEATASMHVCDQKNIF